MASSAETATEAAAANSVANGTANGASNGVPNGSANGTATAEAVNPFSDPATIPPAPPIPATPSPPPTARTAKRQSHIVSFDKTLENIIKLETHDLDIQDTELVVVDKEKRKKNRHTCVGSSAAYRLSIPLYNVLWAAVSDDNRHLVIDYANTASKTRIRPAKLSVALEPSGPDRPTPADVAAWAELLRNRAYGDVPLQRRAYVLVNPHAGPGGAMKKWEHEARPLMDAARMALTVVTTTHSGQAVELCTALDIDAYDMVIACSGDGLPHECFNGLGQRPDARRALERVAVAHIPCGSGNAMACNLYGSHHVSVAALAIVKGVVAPLDLASITFGETRLLSFLSQAVGVMAEVDLATENLRWMGSARFTWGFIERLLARRVYPCDLAVKVEIEHKDDVKAHYSRLQGVGSGSKSNASTSASAAAGRIQQQQAKMSQGSASSATDVDVAGEGSSAAGASSSDGDLSLPPLQFGTINDPLPDDWETIPEDKMGNFYCGNMPYMAPDASFFSAALMSDGLMDLITIDGDISPAKSLGMLLTVEDNRLFDHPLVRYRKIAGFRLTPKNQKDGYISIDGERIPFSPFQAEVHKGLGRVIAKRAIPGYEAPGPNNWDKVSPVEHFMA